MRDDFVPVQDQDLVNAHAALDMEGTASYGWDSRKPNGNTLLVILASSSKSACSSPNQSD